MTKSERYLLCQAARYPLVIRAQTMLRIWPINAPTPEPFQDLEPLDLRRLLGGLTSEEGIAIGLERAKTVGVLIVDRIGGFTILAESEFVALPAVFEFACGIFDAACRREIDGGHPLRLRPDPNGSSDQALLGPL